MKDIYAMVFWFTMICVFLPLEKHSFSFFKLYLAFTTLIPASRWDAFNVLRLPLFNTVTKKCWPSSSTCSRIKTIPQDLIAVYLTAGRKKNTENMLITFKGRKKKEKKKRKVYQEGLQQKLGQVNQGKDFKPTGRSVSKQTYHNLVVED